jgi:hypothetical protein
VIVDIRVVLITKYLSFSPKGSPLDEWIAFDSQSFKWIALSASRASNMTLAVYLVFRPLVYFF